MISVLGIHTISRFLQHNNKVDVSLKFLCGSKNTKMVGNSVVKQFLFLCVMSLDESIQMTIFLQTRISKHHIYKLVYGGSDQVKEISRKLLPYELKSYCTVSGETLRFTCLGSVAASHTLFQPTGNGLRSCSGTKF